MKGAGYLCSFPAFGITQLSPSGSGKKKTLKITVLPTPLQRLRHTAAFTYTDLLSTPRRNFSSSNRSHLVMHKQRQQLTHLHSPGEWAGIVLFLGTLATTARPAGLWAPSLSPYLSCFQLEVAFYSGWPYIWNNIVQSLRKILFPKSQESRTRSLMK